MFSKAHFAKTPRGKIKKEMEKDGFTPIVIQNDPGYIYEEHKHKETKYLVCLEGAMQVTFNNKTYAFEPGDKLIIAGNTKHSAIVGEKGCSFYWAEKITT